MVDRTLAFTALGSVGICIGLFSLRLHGVVGHGDPVLWALNTCFIGAEVLATATSSAFVARSVFKGAKSLPAGFRYVLSILPSITVFIGDAVISLYFLVGMNWLGK